jgi:glycosyltransferase involved in cell wall biosynthesis
MKINWFSPLPPAKTGIATATGLLLPALAERAGVTLWTSQPEWDGIVERWAKVRRFDADELNHKALNQADITFFNLGNNALFHSAIWEASQRHRGITILHDICLQHFYAGYYRQNRQDRGAYVGEMRRYYQERGHIAAEAFWNGQTKADDLVEHFPLTQLALCNTLGVIVHTRSAFAEIKKMGRWPVAYLPLLRPACEPPRPENRDDSGPARKIIMFGHMGLNRRIESTLEALARFPQKSALRLDIYGDLENESVVRTQIAALRLERIVHVHGFVAEEELVRALRAADLGINLRYPTMGEASGSQLQLWEYSLPALVTATGFYADLPADTVAFVRPESEIEDIQSHLRDFLADPQRFREMGKRGRKYLEKHHSSEGYVEGLLQMTTYAREFGRDLVANNLARRVGVELGVWFSPDQLEPSCQRATQAISGMLC